MISLQIVASCAMEYADIVLDQLEKESYYEGNANEFDVKEKVLPFSFLELTFCWFLLIR